MLAFCDNTNEALTGLLRPGNAGSDTAVDHTAVIDAALAQIPAEYRHGYPVLFRFDGAGASKALLAHLRGLRHQGVQAEFTVGWAVTPANTPPSRSCPRPHWTPAIDAGGDPRDGAAVVELTGMLPAETLAAYPEGVRVIARRERPHPGAQLDLIEERDGWRYTCLATDTQTGQHAFLDAPAPLPRPRRRQNQMRQEHRAGPVPLEVVRGQRRLARLRADRDRPARPDPDHPAARRPGAVQSRTETLRYRPLHVAARLVHGGRRLRLEIDRTWRWAQALARAFTASTRCPHRRSEPAPPTLRAATDNPGTEPGRTPTPAPTHSANKINSEPEDHHASRPE